MDQRSPSSSCRRHANLWQVHLWSLSLSEPLTVSTGPWKDPLHRVPVPGLLIKRQERKWPVWTHSQPLCIPPISVSSPFSLFLSLTQSLYLYVAFGLHRSLFRGIRSSCAAQVMLAQMKQNGLFSLSRITLASLPWPYLFSFPLLNLIFSVQALFNLLSLLPLLCLSFYFPLFCILLLFQSHLSLLPLF